MAVPGNRYQQTLPMIGGIVLLFVFFSLLLMCVMVDVMQVALRKLHLDPGWAALIVMGIFIGSLFNIPVRRFPRDELQPVVRGAIYGLGVWHPVVRHVRSETVLAVNVGGCVIPTAVALYELPFIVNGGLQPILALVIAVTVNVAVCYRFATLVDGVGM